MNRRHSRPTQRKMSFLDSTCSHRVLANQGPRILTWEDGFRHNGWLVRVSCNAIRAVQCPRYFSEINAKDSGWTRCFLQCLYWRRYCLLPISQRAPSPVDHRSQVFSRLRKVGLKLHPSKCRFAFPEVPYSGHIISAKVIQTKSELWGTIQFRPVWEQWRSYTRACPGNFVLGHKGVPGHHWVLPTIHSEFRISRPAPVPPGQERYAMHVVECLPGSLY